jgi:hypothetical protein
MALHRLGSAASRERDVEEAVGASHCSLESRIPELLAKYRSWQAVLYESGPLDEPTFLFEAARVWLIGAQLPQAATDFARCAELAPDWPRGA